MGTNKKTIAIYCRTAIADDAAIERQKKSLESHIRQNYSCTDIVCYSDNGCSGMDFDRPALNRLNRDIEDGKVDMVIVQSLSRIGRDSGRTLKWVEALPEKGVSLVAMDCPKPLLFQAFYQSTPASD